MKDQENATYDTWLSKHGGFAKDMTLRDYFAAAFVASGHTLASDRVAAQAYLLADAMLK